MLTKITGSLIWLYHWLFRLLPSKWFLRLHGVKLRSEPRVTTTVTYILHGEEKQTQVEFGNATAVVKTFPLWFNHGFVEPVSSGSERYFIPPHEVLRTEWYDPILEDYFVVDRHDDTGLAESRPASWAWSVGQANDSPSKETPHGPRPKVRTGR